jgi:LysM repeat protein
MSNKTFTQVSVLLLILVAFFAVPSHAQAGGVCGGTFTVEQGETLESIAALCGTTVSIITAANPGISGALTVGQVITVPGSNYTGSSTPVPGTTTVTNNYYITNNFYNSVPSSTTSNGTYVVQPGDTFSSIAQRFGVSVDALRAANPGIADINLLFIGQVINLPTSSGTSSGGITIQPAPTQELIPRSWGSVPNGTPHASVRLSNKSKTEVYISLQGTTHEGDDVIREYPVDGTMVVRVPAGWYVYVAWVGGRKIVGQFNLIADTTITLTINKDKITVE